jgi:hypothetical protein
MYWFKRNLVSKTEVSQMRKVLIAAAAVLLLAGVASAQVTYSFHCAGQGNMVKDSPVVYAGNIDTGDLAPGVWTMTIDDAGWPAVGDDAARWAHIFANYYTYDPGAFLWDGFFQQNMLYLEKTAIGTMTGDADMSLQIIDFNMNGIIDNNECFDGLSGAVIIIQDGTGAYAELCGNGTYNGSYFRDCAGTTEYMLDNVDFNMQLDLQDCAMSTEASTWSAVKGLFR